MYRLKPFQLIISCSLFSAVSLRHLCMEDKQRVHQLITDLAIAEQEKASAKIELDKERGQFRDALIELNRQMLLLEGQRNDIPLCQKLDLSTMYMYMSIRKGKNGQSNTIQYLRQLHLRWYLNPKTRVF